jgi:hypothetical protein
LSALSRMRRVPQALPHRYTHAPTP